MFILPKSIYKFNVIPYQDLNGIYCRNRKKKILKQLGLIAKTIEKENQSWKPHSS